MRAAEFVTENKVYQPEDFEGIRIGLSKDESTVGVEAYDALGREIGDVVFTLHGLRDLEAQNLYVDDRFRGQGIAQTMYNYVKSKGYKIRRSEQQTDAGAGFWTKHRGEERVWEQELDEYAETDRSVIDALQQKGYRLLGSGVDQTAFAEPGTGHVLKIFGTDETNKFSRDHQMFFKWYKFCEKNQANPFLPRFYGHESFMWPPGADPKEQHRYLMIRTEELDDSGSAGSILSAMASEIAHNVSIDDIIRFSKEINPNSFDKLMKKIGDQGLDQFLATVKKLFLIGERAGYSWDLHDGNIMMRKNGTPVINDPWVL